MRTLSHSPLLSPSQRALLRARFGSVPKPRATPPSMPPPLTNTQLQQRLAEVRATFGSSDPDPSTPSGAAAIDSCLEAALSNVCS